MLIVDDRSYAAHMSSSRIRGAVAGLAAAGMLLVGCADPDNAHDGEPSGLTSLLAELPAAAHGSEDDLVQIALADLDRAAEFAGVTRPAGSTDHAVVKDYLDDLSGVFEDRPPVAVMLPEVAQPTTVANIAEFADELGWAIADVAWFAEYQTQPHLFTVLGGDIERDRLTSALGEPSDDGIWRIGGDDDYHMDLNERTAARPLGQALRQALADDRLIVGRSTPAVEAALSGGDTLADHPVLSALAAELDAEDAYSALIMAADPSRFSSDLPPSVPEGYRGMPEPFTGIAIGSAYADETPYAIFVYSHADSAAAEVNADHLRALLEEGESLRSAVAWSHYFEIEHIRVDDTTVVARLALRNALPSFPFRVVVQRENIASIG